MKLFYLFSFAFAKECYDYVLPKGLAAERMSVGELKVASEEFFKCARHDSSLDMTPYKDAISQPKGLCYIFCHVLTYNLHRWYS